MAKERKKKVGSENVYRKYIIDFKVRYYKKKKKRNDVLRLSTSLELNKEVKDGLKKWVYKTWSY
jgi:hypothetical protein